VSTALNRATVVEALRRVRQRIEQRAAEREATLRGEVDFLRRRSESTDALVADLDQRLAGLEARR